MCVWRLFVLVVLVNQRLIMLNVEARLAPAFMRQRCSLAGLEQAPTRQAHCRRLMGFGFCPAPAGVLLASRLSLRFPVGLGARAPTMVHVTAMSTS